MSKRTVAFAARVSCLQDDSDDKCKKRTSEENAFLHRSYIATKEVFQFSAGWEIINKLIDLGGEGGDDLDDIRIHDHGWVYGIIGDGYNVGMYTENFHNSRGIGDSLYQQATAGNFGYRVSKGQIKLAKKCSIVIYGCNCSVFAQELSRFLGSVDRADVAVTGADNNVYEKSGRARVDSQSTGISKGEKGKFRTYKGGIEVSSQDSCIYS